MAATGAPTSGTGWRVGRAFVSPAFDVLVIGGGLSLAVLAAVLSLPDRGEGLLAAGLAWAVLFSNSAHFASSTIRLYTKPGAVAAMPFLTLALPILTLAAVAACLVWPDSVGQHLLRLTLTWSPYHYAAQAYGLALVYSYRTGCNVAGGGKRLLWWIAMMPFFFNFLTSGWAGMGWLLPSSWNAHPAATAVRLVAHAVLPFAGFAGPLLLAWWLFRRQGASLPLISLLILLTNASWWFLLPALDAFTWATVFHGLQYLAIVTIFHVKDRAAAGGGPVPAWRHAVPFLGGCVLLGWILFNVLPHAARPFDIGMVESILVVAAAVNVHHFIVDAYIWRLKKTDGNRSIVEQAASASASS